VPSAHTSEETDDAAYNNWTLEAYQSRMVEEIRYMNKWTNDFMIILNGVMMLPVTQDGAFPLSSISGTCEYPIAMSVVEPISNFAYGKSIPAKTKVDQAVFDEMLKALVLKTRKSYFPPLANNTGQVLSKRVLWAGNIEDDINPEKLQPIGDNSGVTQSEFNAMQFYQTVIDRKSVNPIMEGQSQSGSQTAREIVEQKQQSMMRMGLVILGVKHLEQQLGALRLKNILKNWTEPIEDLKERIYRTITIDSSFDDGTEGKRVVSFTENLPDDTQVYAEEELIKKATGKNVRRNYINPKILKGMELKWFVNVTPTEKSSNALKQAQFEESVQKALAIFAPLGKMPNLDYLATRWATNQGEDPDRFWSQEQGMPQGMPMGMPNQLSSQMTPSQPQQPSLNSMLQAG